MRSIKNLEIRTALKDNNLRHWELAKLIGVSENTLIRKLREELPLEDKKKILEIIQDSTKNNNVKEI